MIERVQGRVRFGVQNRYLFGVGGLPCICRDASSYETNCQNASDILGRRYGTRSPTWRIGKAWQSWSLYNGLRLGQSVAEFSSPNAHSKPQRWRRLNTSSYLQQNKEEAELLTLGRNTPSPTARGDMREAIARHQADLIYNYLSRHKIPSWTG